MPALKVPERAYNVLFLCTGNSARSLMSESILKKHAPKRFQAFSAGSRPRDVAHPLAMKILRDEHYPTRGLRPKSWDQFVTLGAPVFDFIFTLCDQAAGENCLAWPGQPLTAHWGIEDPTTVDGTEIEKEIAFFKAFGYLRNRILAFAALPIAILDRNALHTRLGEIGRMEGATSVPPNAA